MIKNYWLDEPLSVNKERWLWGFNQIIKIWIKENRADIISDALCLFLQSKDYGFDGFKCMTTKWSEDENFEYIVFSFDVETKLSFKISKVR